MPGLVAALNPAALHDTITGQATSALHEGCYSAKALRPSKLNISGTNPVSRSTPTFRAQRDTQPQSQGLLVRWDVQWPIVRCNQLSHTVVAAS